MSGSVGESQNDISGNYTNYGASSNFRSMNNSQSFDAWQKNRTVLSTFHALGLSISDFMIDLIRFDQEFMTDYGYLVNDVFEHAGSMFIAFAQHSRSAGLSLQWSTSFSTEIYKGEVRRLTDKSSGLHFNVSNAQAQQISHFASEGLISRISTLAPRLWSLMQSLLLSDGVTSSISDDENQVRVLDLKTSMHIACLLFANNQHCNLLPAINGIFLHTCNTSDRVIDAIWRLNASVSPRSINRAINSLSVESKKRLHEMGQTLLVAYTLDNYDVALKHSTGTVDVPFSTLVHLTSGLILKLAHTSLSDLKHSTFLWERSRYNDRRRHALPVYSPTQLFALRPEGISPGSLNRKEDFCRWKFAIDLCTHGPAFFSQYRDQIPKPKGVDMVPVFKTESVPLRSMEYPNSTVDGNIKAIINAMQQTGVWDIEDLKKAHKDVPDMDGGEEVVILMHGDLGTWERIQSARIRRSIEQTSRQRLQFIVFIPGLFHVKMACADAIWRIFISPAKLQTEKTSMLAFIRLFYPSLTTKISTNKAGFHIMNDCIVRVGVADRLECWRTYVHDLWPTCDTLEKFAEREPTLQDILSMSTKLALKYASPSQILEDLRFGNQSNRDYQYENALTRLDHILLYEELAYSIRCGDVGRIEACLYRWIPIFKGTGKPKYANNLLEFITDLNLVYPESLQKAVRSNWLCNPSGKAMGFRGVDWLLEVNNLYTKVIYGGSGSNYTINRILNESPLIQLYRDCKKVVEDQYSLTPKTTRHGDADLTSTYAALSRLAHQLGLFKNSPTGRESSYHIPNHFAIGIHKFETEATKVGTDTLSLLDDADEEEVTSDDLAVEDIE